MDIPSNASDSTLKRSHRAGYLPASLQIFNNIPDQLADFDKLTEEECDAGIYLGEQPANDYQYSQYLDLNN